MASTRPRPLSRIPHNIPPDSNTSLATFSLSSVLGVDACDDLRSIGLNFSTSEDSNDSIQLQPTLVPRIPDRMTAAPLLDLHSTPFSAHRPADSAEGPVASVPTPPRLKAVTKTRLNVRHWAERVASYGPPEAAPWADTDQSSSTPWTAEGSIHSTADLRALGFRSPHITHTSPSLESLPPGRPGDGSSGGRLLVWPSSPPADPARVRQSAHATHRHALVFECEVTLRDGKQRRSIQVPANSMQRETVDMMLALRDLKTFYSNELGDVSEDGTAGARTPPPPPPAPLPSTPEAHELDALRPTIMVSSSTRAVIPVSIDSFASIERPPSQALPVTPPSLAARRGRKELAPIATKKAKEDLDPYPEMPSSFLPDTAPDCSSPPYRSGDGGESDFTFDGPSMNLDAMILDLRSQCDAIRDALPGTAEFTEEQSISLLTKDPSSSFNGLSETTSGDIWAFADQLLPASGGPRPLDLSSDDDLALVLRGIDAADAETTFGQNSSVSTGPPQTPTDQAPVRSILKMTSPKKVVRFEVPGVADEVHPQPRSAPDTGAGKDNKRAIPTLSRASAARAPTRPVPDEPRASSRLSMLPVNRPSSLPTARPTTPAPGKPRGSLPLRRVPAPQVPAVKPNEEKAPASLLAPATPPGTAGRKRAGSQVRKPSPLRECNDTAQGAVRKAPSPSPSPIDPGAQSLGATLQPGGARSIRRRSEIFRRAPASTSGRATPTRGNSMLPAPQRPALAARATTNSVVTPVAAGRTGMAGLLRQSFPMRSGPNGPAKGKENRPPGMLSRGRTLGKASAPEKPKPKGAAVALAAPVVGVDGALVRAVGWEQKSRMSQPLRSVLSAIPIARQLTRGKGGRADRVLMPARS